MAVVNDPDEKSKKDGSPYSGELKRAKVHGRWGIGVVRRENCCKKYGMTGRGEIVWYFVAYIAFNS